MSDSDVLAATVTSILNDSSLFNIHFSYYGRVVTGMRFQQLLTLIGNGQLVFVVGSLGANVGAKFNLIQGNPFNGVITVPYVNFGGPGCGPERCAIIHECTHAVINYFDGVYISEGGYYNVIINETPAYLAAALYSRFTGQSTLTGPVYDAAYALADAVIAANTDGSTYPVDPSMAVGFSIAYQAPVP